MTVKGNEPGYRYARQLIEDGCYVPDDRDEERKARYKFPYGDFENIHRCGVLAAEARAGQRKYHDVETAAAHLHGSLDAARCVQRQGVAEVGVWCSVRKVLRGVVSRWPGWWASPWRLRVAPSEVRGFCRCRAR
jgi:hypothetical protein